MIGSWQVDLSRLMIIINDRKILEQGLHVPAIKKIKTVLLSIQARYTVYIGWNKGTFRSSHWW